ncbi:neurofilament medium polypeptide-like isoform X2 [Peromyscus californicus insignis]|uniref:neurofilament medium polypeptide-like isoform X2 n=1 Tax=Peromyscus californicus insignis TaxID=564181 RepID=UPI0022A6964A|nr:neurofilament medium polypeptide-like isoform X2 [Peromyscus californicus insignis]
MVSPVNQQTSAMSMVEVVLNRCRRVSTVLNKRCIQTTVIPLDMDGPQVISGTSRETPHIKTEVVHKNSDTSSSSREQGELPVMMVEVESRKHVSPEETQVKVEEVESQSFSCFTSIFKRFYKKKSVIPEVMEEPPAAPAAPAAPADPDIVNTSEEILQTQKKDTKNAPGIKPLFSKDEEFDHPNEGALEEHQSCASEMELWELRKLPSPLCPEIRVLYQAPPQSSDEDMLEEEEEEEVVELEAAGEEAEKEEEEEEEEKVEEAAAAAVAVAVAVAAAVAAVAEEAEEEEEEVVELEAAGEEAEKEEEEEEEEKVEEEAEESEEERGGGGGGRVGGSRGRGREGGRRGGGGGGRGKATTDKNIMPIIMY